MTGRPASRCSRSGPHLNPIERIMIRRSFLATAGLALAAGLTACASLVKEPQVALADIGLSSIGLTGATARVDLTVMNPNSFALNARGVEYELAFYPDALPEGERVPGGSWRTLATGRSAEELKLEAGETTPVTLLVPFSYSELGAAASRLLQDGALRYRFSGAFTVGSPLGDIRIPFDRDGVLDP
jgi:LEA14-like dessication related protein